MKLTLVSITALAASLGAPALAQDGGEPLQTDGAMEARQAAAAANSTNARGSVTLAPTDTDQEAKLGWRDPDAAPAPAPKKTFTPVGMPGLRVKWPARQPRSASTMTLSCAPEFSARPDRKARIRIRLSADSIVERKGDGAIVKLLLPGSAITARSTTRPLVTAFFDTPLRGAQLIPTSAGAELVLWLGESADVTHRVIDRGNGGFELIVELAPAAAAAAAPSLAPESTSGFGTIDTAASRKE